MEKDKETLIDYYSYYYSDSEDFVREYLDNYIEMDQILHLIFVSIKNNKDYKITLGKSAIMIENKKTKESYSIRIEF